MYPKLLNEIDTVMKRLQGSMTVKEMDDAETNLEGHYRMVSLFSTTKEKAAASKAYEDAMLALTEARGKAEAKARKESAAAESKMAPLLNGSTNLQPNALIKSTKVALIGVSEAQFADLINLGKSTPAKMESSKLHPIFLKNVGVVMKQLQGDMTVKEVNDAVNSIEIANIVHHYTAEQRAAASPVYEVFMEALKEAKTRAESKMKKERAATVMKIADWLNVPIEDLRGALLEPTNETPAKPIAAAVRAPAQEQDVSFSDQEKPVPQVSSASLPTQAASSLDGSSSQILSLEQQLKDKDAKIEFLEAQLAGHVEVEKQVQVLQNTADFKNDQLDKLMKKNSDVELERDQAKELVEDLKAECEEYKETIKELTKLTEAPQTTVLELELAAVRKDMEAYETTTDANINDLEGKLGEPSELRKGLLDLLNSNDSQKSKIVNLLGMSEKVQGSVSKPDSRIHEIKAYISHKNNQITRMKEDHFEEIHQMSSSAQELQSRVDDLQKTLSMRDQEVSELRGANQELTTKLQKHTEEASVRLGNELPKRYFRNSAGQLCKTIPRKTMCKSIGNSGEKSQVVIKPLSLEDAMMVQELEAAQMRLQSDNSVDHTDELANIEEQLVKLYSKAMNGKD